jgi:hypothetical protein
MHLNEFADAKEYIPTATDAQDFRNQLLLIWPGAIRRYTGQQKTAAQQVVESPRHAISRESRRRRSALQSLWREPMVGRVIPPNPTSLPRSRGRLRTCAAIHPARHESL